MSRSVIPISINRDLPIDRAINGAPEAREVHPLPSPVSPLPQTAAPQFRPNRLWAQQPILPGPKEQSTYYLKQAEYCAQELAKYPPFSEQWHKWLIKVDLHLIDAKRAAQESRTPSVFDAGRAQQIVLPIYALLMKEAERLADHSVTNDNLFTARDESRDAALYLLYAKVLHSGASAKRIEIPPIHDPQTRTSVGKTIDSLFQIATQFAVEGDPVTVNFLLTRAGVVARGFHRPFDDDRADALLVLAKQNHNFWNDIGLFVEAFYYPGLGLSHGASPDNTVISDLDIF